MNVIVCEECTDQAQDEGVTFDMAVEICVEFGDDMADHTCERLDDDSVHCDCACEPWD